MSPRVPPAESLRRAAALRRYALACRKDLDLLKARERAVQAVLDGGELDMDERAAFVVRRTRLRDERVKAAEAWNAVVATAERLEIAGARRGLVTPENTT